MKASSSASGLFVTRLMLFFGLILSCSACSQKIIPPPEDVITGKDRDSHNCIATAGYTWSNLLENCVRLFETATELVNAQNPEATTVAYVLLDQAIEKGELFLPGKAEGISR